LLHDCPEGYAHQRLGEDERRRWEAEFEAREEGAFCRLFGPEKIPANLDEFLDYFMVRKVIAGQELLNASGPVTGNMLLYDVTDHAPAIDPDEIDDANWVEDYRGITDVEPGKSLVRGWRRADRGAAQGERPRPARPVGVRDHG